VDRLAWRSDAERKRSEQTWIGRAKKIGVPEEALGEEALFWAYVMKQRQDYAKELDRAKQMRVHAANLADGLMDHFLGRLAVDSKFVTEPLAPEQIKAANAWKFDYLRRLRREETDESYINAYLKAWGLSEAEVFSPGN
jgi:hypothetical protein